MADRRKTGKSRRMGSRRGPRSHNSNNLGNERDEEHLEGLREVERGEQESEEKEKKVTGHLAVESGSTPLSGLHQSESPVPTSEPHQPPSTESKESVPAEQLHQSEICFHIDRAENATPLAQLHQSEEEEHGIAHFTERKRKLGSTRRGLRGRHREAEREEDLEQLGEERGEGRDNEREEVGLREEAGVGMLGREMEESQVLEPLGGETEVMGGVKGMGEEEDLGKMVEAREERKERAGEALSSSVEVGNMEGPLEGEGDSAPASVLSQSQRYTLHEADELSAPSFTQPESEVTAYTLDFTQSEISEPSQIHQSQGSELLQETEGLGQAPEPPEEDSQGESAFKERKRKLGSTRKGMKGRQRERTKEEDLEQLGEEREGGGEGRGMKDEGEGEPVGEAEWSREAELEPTEGGSTSLPVLLRSESSLHTGESVDLTDKVHQSQGSEETESPALTVQLHQPENSEPVEEPAHSPAVLQSEPSVAAEEMKTNQSQDLELSEAAENTAHVHHLDQSESPAPSDAAGAAPWSLELQAGLISAEVQWEPILTQLQPNPDSPVPQEAEDTTPPAQPYQSEEENGAAHFAQRKRKLGSTRRGLRGRHREAEREEDLEQLGEERGEGRDNEREEVGLREEAGVGMLGREMEESQVLEPLGGETEVMGGVKGMGEEEDLGKMVEAREERKERAGEALSSSVVVGNMEGPLEGEGDSAPASVLSQSQRYTLHEADELSAPSFTQPESEVTAYTLDFTQSEISEPSQIHQSQGSELLQETEGLGQAPEPPEEDSQGESAFKERKRKLGSTRKGMKGRQRERTKEENLEQLGEEREGGGEGRGMKDEGEGEPVGEAEWSREAELEPTEGGSTSLPVLLRSESSLHTGESVDLTDKVHQSQGSEETESPALTVQLHQPENSEPVEEPAHSPAVLQSEPSVAAEEMKTNQSQDLELSEAAENTAHVHHLDQSESPAPSDAAGAAPWSLELQAGLISAEVQWEPILTQLQPNPDSPVPQEAEDTTPPAQPYQSEEENGAAHFAQRKRKLGSTRRGLRGRHREAEREEDLEQLGEERGEGRDNEREEVGLREEAGVGMLGREMEESQVLEPLGGETEVMGGVKGMGEEEDLGKMVEAREERKERAGEALSSSVVVGNMEGPLEGEGDSAPASVLSQSQRYTLHEADELSAPSFTQPESEVTAYTLDFTQSEISEPSQIHQSQGSELLQETEGLGQAPEPPEEDSQGESAFKERKRKLGSTRKGMKGRQRERTKEEDLEQLGEEREGGGEGRGMKDEGEVEPVWEIEGSREAAEYTRHVHFLDQSDSSAPQEAEDTTPLAQPHQSEEESGAAHFAQRKRKLGSTRRGLRGRHREAEREEDLEQLGEERGEGGGESGNERKEGGMRAEGEEELGRGKRAQVLGKPVLERGEERGLEGEKEEEEEKRQKAEISSLSSLPSAQGDVLGEVPHSAQEEAHQQEPPAPTGRRKKMGSSRRGRLGGGRGGRGLGQIGEVRGEGQADISDILQRIQEVFRSWDHEEKGFITREDMQGLGGELGLSAGELQMVFDGLDRDGDGLVTRQDFTVGMRKFLGSQQTKPSVYQSQGCVVPEDVDDEERQHFLIMMDSLGAHSLLQDQSEIWKLWAELRQNEPHLLGNLEEFVSKVTDQIRAAQREKETLERTLQKRIQDHNQGVQHLYEEMERQISSEKEKVRSESFRKSHSQRAELERALDKKNAEVQGLVMVQNELEDSVLQLRSQQRQTSCENEELRRTNRELEAQLERIRAQLQEAQSRMQDLRSTMMARRHGLPQDAGPAPRDPADPSSAEGSAPQRRGQLATQPAPGEQPEQLTEGPPVIKDFAEWRPGPRARVISIEEDPLPDIIAQSQAGQRLEAEVLWEEEEKLAREQNPWTPPLRSRERLYNVVLVGSSSVGKTSFLRRFQSGVFSADHGATIGLDSCIQTLTLGGGQVLLQLWDTAGQERFHSITKQVLRKADGLVVMYDVGSAHSFAEVRYWVTCIQEGTSDDVVILLLGNKSDSTTKREVPPEEGERLAREYRVQFLECSAASGHNVTEAMTVLARMLCDREEAGHDDMVTLKEPPRKKKGCC
ncbi:uncharacterized protein LOC136749100 isoform X3 [Amia ocellicauda]|uniref:uncharacterized protein LOC136749100 isoform X3 n=1 Tax=Amia ocellicauda TaxID=2972642 RepID=UPI0034645366